MEHTAHSGKFLHDGKTVGVRLAVVHDDGEVQLLRQRELIAQYPLLKLSRRVLLPVVVQPDLADGNDLRLPRPRAERVQTVLREGRAALGMPAARREEPKSQPGSRISPTPCSGMEASSASRSASNASSS